MPKRNEKKLDEVIQKIKSPEIVQPPIMPRPVINIGIEKLNPAASQSDIIKKINELIEAKI